MLKIGNLGEGGQGISEGHKGAGVTTKELFEAIRDELDNGLVVVTSSNATDLAEVITLANEIKALLNAASSAEKLFEK